MKTSRFLIAAAFLPFGCGPAGQNAPPPLATATPAPPVAVATEQPATPPPASAGTPASFVAVEKAPPTRSAPPPRPERTRPVRAEVPVETAPPVRSAPPARVRLDIPAGTLLPIEIQTAVSSDTSQEGDEVNAVLTEDVPLNGFRLDRGAEVRGHVTTAIPAKRVSGRARLAISFNSVMESGEKLSISTDRIDSMGKSTGSKDKKIIGGGALGGLIIGAVKDGKKGAVIGTVIGAAAGTGAVLIMKGDEVEIPRGSRLTLAVR